MADEEEVAAAAARDVTAIHNNFGAFSSTKTIAKGLFNGTLFANTVTLIVKLGELDWDTYHDEWLFWTSLALAIITLVVVIAEFVVVYLLYIQSSDPKDDDVPSRAKLLNNLSAFIATVLLMLSIATNITTSNLFI